MTVANTVRAVAIRRPQELFPAQWFSVESSDGDCGATGLLHPAEARLVSRAVPKRRSEFAAGRACARRALGRLGCADQPLLRDAHGSPTWPPAVLGSISHAPGCVISVTARRAHVAAVGVDVERWVEGFPHAVMDRVATSGEREWLARGAAAGADKRDLYAFALFSIKEAIYKCIYVGTGQRLGFHDANVRFDLSQGLFRAELGRPVAGQRRLTGRVGCNASHVFSGVWWFASAANAEENTHEH